MARASAKTQPWIRECMTMAEFSGGRKGPAVEKATAVEKRTERITGE
jgi:hypothetical protein